MEQWFTEERVVSIATIIPQSQMNSSRILFDLASFDKPTEPEAAIVAIATFAFKGSWHTYDNAVAESVFGSLKQEMVYLENVFETREKARVEILKYIKWYNADRLHSTIGYTSPNDFEKGNVTKAVA